MLKIVGLSPWTVKGNRSMKKLTLVGAGLMFALAGSSVASELSAQDRAALDLTNKKFDDAFNAKDPAALAELFTTDAIRVTPDGIARGRDEIRKQIAAEFKTGSGLVSKTTFAVMSGNVAVVGGEWSVVGNQTQRGYWSSNFMREGDDMKISFDTYNVAKPATAPNALK
jgi:ketosteroid isomerase-like protein